MTIIKVTKDGKILGKKKADETVVPLAPESSEPAGRTLHISYVPSARSKRLVNVFLLIIALLVLSAGIIGGVYLYKYMQHRHRVSRISVQYEDDKPKPDHQTESVTYMTMEEDIDIRIEEELERIEVPRFDECRQSVILHDFHMNYTVIVDNEDQECFIMDLDRKQISPPKSFAELIRKYSSGYYMPRVDVVRRDYRVITPALKNLQFAGPAIAMECAHYDSYKLEKREPVPLIEFHFKYVKTYGFSNLRQVIKDRIMK
ncbi:integral membrane protein 2B-like isoform X2 [Ruditapes philippinarum]|uniref:integral membrane protein 2B-like isoform X2 n=1 Tax=Ruditapes philippinarum TaxID=129788 RepID=UPI00295A9AE8|nr:integral membrane protein 2B-like isoform X2 [Ruditapes philippinarum]